MRRFVIGDIHGANRALLQCFERSGFDANNDLLISLGDICDGWPEVSQSLDTLLTVKNLVLLMGNHDQWMLEWLQTGATPSIWLTQGGRATVKSFPGGVSESQKKLIENASLYHVLDNMLFVHGGFDPQRPVDDQYKHELLWDRTLVKRALHYKSISEEHKLSTYDRIYVGHTPTLNFGTDKPIFACEVCMLDTGARWPGGVLTIMNIDTGEWFSSDEVEDLYD